MRTIAGIALIIIGATSPIGLVSLPHLAAIIIGIALALPAAAKLVSKIVK